MAELRPIDQEAPGQPAVTAPTILTGARRNTSLDMLAGSSICVGPCQCPKGYVRACAKVAQPADNDPQQIEDRETFTFDGFDWQAIDENEIDECGDSADPAGTLQDIVGAGAAYMLGRELDSAPLTGNPSLQAFATDVAPDIIPSPTDAVTMLLHAAAIVGQYRSTFIAADHMLPTLIEAGLVSQVNGQWRLAGRPIIFSPGISGLGPDGFDPGPGAAFLYLATGSVDYNWRSVSLSEVGLSDSAEAVRQNTQWQLAQASGIIRFNPSCVHAVAVCLTHVSCCAGDADAMNRAADGEAAVPSGVTEIVEANAEHTASLVDAAIARQEFEEQQAQDQAAASAEAIARVAAEEQAAHEVAMQELVEINEELGLYDEDVAFAADEPVIEPVIETDVDTEVTITEFTPEPIEVPQGTMTEVLEWVDGDAIKASAAISAEASIDGRNRSTLISALNEIIEG